LGVLAIVVFAVQAADASAFAYCEPGNLENCDPNLPGSPPGPSQGPYAATGGAVWIQTGSAAPVAVDFDLNLEFMYSTSASGPFADLVSLKDGTTPAVLLLSNGTADNWFIAHQYEDPGTGLYYPGYWGIFTPPSTDVEPWGIPGTDASGYYYTKVRAWTGDFDSFAAATAGGASFAESGAFVTHFAYSTDPNVGDFAAMPSMILRPYLPGDANQDGHVDINDLTIVLANYGQSGKTWVQGEFTGDGTVDINDLTIVLAHYDQSLGSKAGGLAAVPEPSAVILLTALLPAAGWLVGRRIGSRKS
jgi:hypothetical protein